MVWSALDRTETGQDPDAVSAAVDNEGTAGHPVGPGYADPGYGQPRQHPGYGQPGHHPGYGHTGHAGDQTRARILSVALELISDRGFAATSTREIAERLGFTKAALYYHFRTKDDLLAAIVEPAMADLGALVERGQGARTAEERRDLVQGYVNLVETHADLIRVLASDPSVKESPGLHAALPVFRRLIPVLAGSDDPDTAQRTRVRAALTAVHGALVQAQPGDDPEVVRATAFEAACAVLGLPAPRPNESETETGYEAKGDFR